MVAAAVVIFVAADAVAIVVIVVVFVFVDIYCTPYMSPPLGRFHRLEKTVGWKLLLQKKTDTRINGFLEIAICSTRLTIHAISWNSCIRKRLPVSLAVSTQQI